MVLIIASGTDHKFTPAGGTTPPAAGTSADQRARRGHDQRRRIAPRTPADVLDTLLHEAAHALAAARGIKDTSRQGRYHNKK